MGTKASDERVAVVLSGAAARGAFQAGALAELMPALEERDLGPTVFLGTSAGSINAALWGSFAHLGTAQAASSLLAVWRSMDQDDVFAHPLGSLPRAGWAFVRGLVSAGTGVEAVLDTRPLVDTARTRLVEAQLAANVESGVVGAVGAVATRMPPVEAPDGVSSGHSVVFLDTRLDASGVDDPGRALVVAPGPVLREHVLASSAIPMAFPAVEVTRPKLARGWYNDGGVRLNTPLRPAIALGATRLVVVAANSTSYGRAPQASLVGSPRPDVADAAAQVLHAVLADRMIEDLQALRTRNHLVAEAEADNRHATHPDGRPYRAVRHLTVSPDPGVLGAVATDLWSTRRRSRPWEILADSGNWLLARFLRGIGDGPGRSELLSYLFFDEEYFDAQITLGREVARRALDAGWLLS